MSEGRELTKGETAVVVGVGALEEVEALTIRGNARLVEHRVQLALGDLSGGIAVNLSKGIPHLAAAQVRDHLLKA